MQSKIKHLSVLFLLLISTNFINHFHLATQDHDQTESKIYNYQHKENQFDPQKKYQWNPSFRKRKNLAKNYSNYFQIASWSDYFLSDSNQKDKKLTIDLPFTNYYDIEQKITPTLQLQFKYFILYSSYYLCQQRKICDIIKGDWTAVLSQVDYGKNKKGYPINNHDQKLCQLCRKHITYNMATLIVFYNFMTKFIETSNIGEVLSHLIIADTFKVKNRVDDRRILGLANITDDGKFEVYLKTYAIRPNTFYNSINAFFDSQFSSPDKNHPILHELGHIAVNYLSMRFNTNVYSLFKNFIDQVFNIINSNDNINKNNFYDAFQLSTSFYACVNQIELIAEGFCFWLIKNKYRTKTWDIWDDFFSIYLVKSLKEQKNSL